MNNQLTENQKRLLEVLVEVRDFLNEHDITFYLFGGSCIGALRHHGFIPWDDDLDICMDLANYKKLISVADELPDDLEFCCFDSHDDYFKPFAQFSSKKDTCFYTSRIYNKGLCMGTLVDVMVMDYVPSSRSEDYKKDIILYEDVLGFYRLFRNEIANYKEEYYQLVKLEKKIGRRAVIEQLQGKLEQYTPDESDTLVIRFWVKTFRQYKKEWFGEPRMIDFEGYLMPVPSHAEATLRLQYGYNWYVLPESEEQAVHNYFVDYDISSNNYVEDCDQFLNVDNVAEMFEKRKHYQVARLDSFLKMEKVKDALLCKRILLEIKKSSDDGFGKFDQVIKNIRAFNNSGLVNVFDSETIDNWAFWLIRSGRSYDAKKILDIFCSDSGEALWGDLAGALLILLAACQDRDITLISSTMDRIRSKYPTLICKIPDCLIAKNILLKQSYDNAAALSLIDDCQGYLKQFTNNYDIMKVEADALRLIGKDQEANTLYDIVRKNSRNGLDLLELL